MNHFSEHVLEMYVVGSEKVESQRLAIETHLNECDGCRTLVNEIREFYGEVQHEYNRNEDIKQKQQKALSPLDLSVTPLNEPFSTPVLYKPQTIIQKLQYYLIRYPLRTVSSGVAITGALFALAFFAFKDSQDTNPQFFFENFKENTIEFYNKKNEKLWQLVAYNLEEQSGANRKHGSKSSILTDINGDQKNEFITVSMILGEQKEFRQCPLTIYLSQQKLLVKHYFEQNITYLDRIYNPQYSCNCITVLNTTDIMKKEIFVSTANIGRSPAFIARMNNAGKIMGKYWHFGNFSGVDTIDLNHDGNYKLILWGQNDTQDTTRGEYGFIAILDPLKIIGDKKSTASPGFGFEPTSAELFYIKFPGTEFNSLLYAHSYVRTYQRTGENLLEFVDKISTSTELPAFSFFFNKNMEVVEVKSSINNSDFYAKMKAEGKINFDLDRVYLEKLKHGVQYWDGKEWKSEVTKVIYQK